MIPQELMTLIDGMVQGAVKGETSQLPLQMSMKDGSVRWVRIIALPDPGPMVMQEPPKPKLTIAPASLLRDA